MEIKETPLKGLFIIQPRIFSDERGLFFESFHQKNLSPIAGSVTFVQDNQSISKKNVLRGLHFQKPPFSQIKLAAVLRGSVLDIVVDIRKNSPTFGQHFRLLLSEQNKTMLWIPEGFAHGFLALEENTHFYYKCSNFYDKESEEAILWSDPDLKIDWGITHPIISEKDRQAKPFNECQSLF